MNRSDGQSLRGGARSGAIVLAVLAAAGCSGGAPESYRPELYDQYYPSRPTETKSTLVRCQEIVFWEKDPTKKERLGYLETWEITPKGSLDSVTQFRVYDLNKKSPFGMISDVGETHVWKQGGGVGNGRWQRIGEFSLTEAAKVLFKRSNKTNVAFEAMEYMPRED